jgi:hypothetical protein
VPDRRTAGTALAGQRAGAPDGVGFHRDHAYQLSFSRAITRMREAMEECTDAFEAGFFV